MRIKAFAATALVVTLGLITTACGSDDEGDDNSKDVDKNVQFESGTTMARLADAGTVKIGTKFDQPGFGLVDLDGKPQGFDVEIAELIAGKLGIPADKIEWVETQSAVREEFIEQDKADFVVATYTINDKRKQRVDFAGPYYEAGQAIMVKKDDDSIKGPDDFKTNDKKICSVTGSTPAETIKQYLADEADQLVTLATYDLCVSALKEGTVDAVTTDNVILMGYIDQSDGAYKLTGDTFTKEPYGIGVKKGDDKFRAFINDALEEVAQSGRYAEVWKDTAGKFTDTTPTLPELDRY